MFIEGPVLGWGSLIVVGAMVLAVITGAWFLALQRSSIDPMVPLQLFEAPSFSGTVCAALLQTMAYYGSLFLLPLVLQEAGRSPFQVGISLIPMTLATGAVATLSGMISNLIGPRFAGALGMFIGAIGACLLALTGFEAPVLTIGGLMIGIGGGTLPIIVGACLSSVPSSLAGTGSGVMHAARQTGGVMGIALLGGLLNGTGNASIAMLVIGLSFLSSAFITLRRFPRHQAETVGEF